MPVDAKIRYEPLISAPQNVEQLRFWAQNELRKIGFSTQNIDDVLTLLNAGILERMRWEGNWAAGSYVLNDVVYNDPLLMIANKDTSEEPTLAAVDWDLMADSSGGGGIGEAPLDGQIYGRQLGDWVVCCPCSGPDESGYDTYIRDVIQPNLWIQGYNGVVNAVLANPIAPTLTQAGINAFPTTGTTGPDGTGLYIDGNGGPTARELTSGDLIDWTLIQEGSEPSALSFPGPTSLRLQGPDVASVTPATVTWELQGIVLRQFHGYDWINNLEDAYDPASPPPSYNVSQNVDGFHATGPVDSGDVPVAASGINTIVGSSSEITVTMDLDFDNVNTESCYMTTTFSIIGHGGSVWTWPEATWVSDSSYTFSFISTYMPLRFGLNSQRQDLYTGGWTSNGPLFWINGGILTVDHRDAGTWPLLAMPSGYITITFDKALSELKLYVNGVPTTTFGTVTIGAGAATGLEGIGATSLASGAQYPVISPFMQMFHVDRALTPTEVSDLYAARLLP